MTVTQTSHRHFYSFQFLRSFPKRYRHTFFEYGKARCKERKMLSSESVGLSKKAKCNENYAKKGEKKL